jgi:regulator of RNase E activity RraA
MTDLAKRLEACYASAVHDVLRLMGYANCVLPPSIRGLDPTRRLAGEVYTVSGHVDQTLSRHETLLRWVQVLSRVPGGKVLVCQPQTKAIALMGELSAQALMAKGTRGYVVDGHCRDTEMVLELGFPVFCEAATPADIVERWTYDGLGQPVTIGSVTIESGDWVIADRDGVVVIPAAAVEEAVARSEEVMATESDMRAAIVGGMDPEQAYLKYGKF